MLKTWKATVLVSLICSSNTSIASLIFDQNWSTSHTFGSVESFPATLNYASSDISTDTSLNTNISSQSSGSESLSGA